MAVRQRIDQRVHKRPLRRSELGVFAAARVNRERFPSAGGYRYFLIEAPATKVAEAKDAPGPFGVYRAATSHRANTGPESGNRMRQGGTGTLTVTAPAATEPRRD